jgi:hypothetical protein
MPLEVSVSVFGPYAVRSGDQVTKPPQPIFVQLGKMYGTTSEFYMLVGPNWQGEVPRGITKVFRSPTNRAASMSPMSQL